VLIRLKVRPEAFPTGALETFLFGATFGMRIIILSWYTQNPGCLAASIEKVAEMGRVRRAREEEKKLKRERLKTIGFTDKKIDEIL
jgi:hypothetical protein